MDDARLIAVLVLVLCVGLLPTLVFMPRMLNSSFYDQPASFAAPTQAQLDAYPAFRARMVRVARRIRLWSLVVGVPAAMFAVIFLLVT